MAFQTTRLVMAGLGVADEKNDANRRLNPPAPPLAPGVHLRWAFPPDRGFPWGGFYLFRRPHVDADQPLVVKPNEPPGTNLNADYSIWWAPNPPLRAVLIRSNSTLFVDGTGDVTHPAGYRISGSSAFSFHLFPRDNPAHKVSVKMIAADEKAFEVAAYCGNEAVVTAEAFRNGNVVEAVLEFDAITGVEIRPAGVKSLPEGWVVEVTFYEVARSVAKPPSIARWEALVTEPIRLPVTHPFYPCTPGQPEDVEAERLRARLGVSYGAADDILLPPSVLATGGQVRVSLGSPLVLGAGTVWTNSLGGAVLQVGDEKSLYGVAEVLAPDKLLLSRPYEGAKAGVPQDYRIVEDVFGQLHDQCVSLVREGATGQPMHLRAAPPTIPAVGTLSVLANQDAVNGVGTNWGPELEGLELVIMGADEGRITLTHGSDSVRGDAAAVAEWRKTRLTGMALQLDGGPSTYTIKSFDAGAGVLKLNRNYEGADMNGTRYAITEQAIYRVKKVDGPASLTLNQPYRGEAGVKHKYRLLVRLTSDDDKTDNQPPSLPRHKLLDLVLLQAMHPALAKVIGLYWIDQPPAKKTGYDYLLLADYAAKFGTASSILGAFLEDPKAQDGYVVFNKGIDVPVVYAPAGVPPVTYIPLSPPQNPRAYDLPGTGVNPQHPATVNDTSAGLMWDLSEAGLGPLLPDRALMYHLWRAELGDGDLPKDEKPPRDEDFKILTPGSPLMVAPSTLPNGLIPPRPPRWPRFRMHAIDRAPDEGWYSYQVHGIDIFGRHSAVSDYAHWMQWTPAPNPLPWYYDKGVGDGLVKQAPATYAIRLLDQVSPPPPAGVEAFALDFDDPTLVRDEAYQRWYATLSAEEQKNEQKQNVGLRVRWTWTGSHMKQAPDTKEFRLYFQSGHLNSQRGRVLKVTPGGTESVVETDLAIPEATPADAYAGAYLHCGGLPYRITASYAGSPLRVRVQNFGVSYNTGGLFVQPSSAIVKGTIDTKWTPAMAGSRIRIFNGAEVTEYSVLEVRAKDELLLSRKFYGTPTLSALSYLIYETPPVEGGACTLALNEAHTHGRIAVAHRERRVRGSDTRWGRHLLGSSIRIGDDPTEYKVMTLDVDRQELELERDYENTSEKSTAYAILNPSHTDYAVSSNWQQRFFVVAYDDANSYTLNKDGSRLYEVFLPRAGAPSREWLPLLTSVEDTVAYANVAVSAVDDKKHTKDDGKWAASAWGDRLGNEGKVSTPAKIFRVHRVPPAPPSIPPASPSVYATSPDYHNHSFYTFRWYHRPHLRAHILRAMDETLFQVDWASRSKSRTGVLVGDPVFPQEYQGDTQERIDLRAAIAAQINELNDTTKFPDSAEGTPAALAYYRHILNNDALRVLAGLSGNELAFTQVTIQPLDEKDAPDRKGPDDPPDYIPHTDDLCAYTDTLDGGSRNRFFYRALFVDSANNRGGLSFCSPPVNLPKTVPPRVPALTSLLATGEREITIKWASNRESDLAQYHIYRTEFSDDARDVRLMQKLGAMKPASDQPEDRPAEESWIDENLDGGRTYYYRVAAEDDAGNSSEACAAKAARAYELSPPLAHEWEYARWNDKETGIELKWKPKDARKLQTRVLKKSTAGNWYPLTDWLPPETLTYIDWHLPAGQTARYRLRVRSAAGNLNLTDPAKDQSVDPPGSSP